MIFTFQSLKIPSSINLKPVFFNSKLIQLAAVFSHTDAAKIKSKPDRPFSNLCFGPPGKGGLTLNGLGHNAINKLKGPDTGGTRLWWDID